jgi:hypothetical protein
MDKDRISKNKIRTQTLYEYDYKNGKPESKGTKARIDSFDILGNRVIEVNYRATGTIHYIMSYKYDGSGNKTEYAKYSGNDRKLNYKESIKFDSKGNKLYENGFNGVDTFRITYNYNRLEKLAEVNQFILRNLNEKRSFSYNGNTADIKVTDGDGKLKFIQKNTYSPTGKIIEETQIEPDNTESRRVVYSYDSNDNLTSETKFIKGKQIGKITRIYNNKGLLSEVYQEGVNMPKFMTNKYTYNDKNWLIEELSRSEPNDEFSKNTFTYDDNGICKTINSYYASFKQQVLSVFVYTTY